MFILNYLIWRQNDCKRNNTFTLYKYFDENLHGKSLQYMSKALSFYLSKLELSFDLRKIIYGNILKKEKKVLYECDTLEEEWRI